MADPAPVRPRVKDARAYEAALRAGYINPFLADMTRRLALVAALNDAYAALRAGVTAWQARSRAGIPIEAIVQAFARVRDYNKQKMFTAFRRALGVDIRPLMSDAGIQTLLRERVTANVSLISTIPERFHDSLREKMVAEFTDQPFDAQRLSRLLREEYRSVGYNNRRIVRTELAKWNGQLNEHRQQQLGVTSFTWISSRDERVRPEHVLRDGVTYEWANPPDGEIPGEPIQCRCVARAVLTPANAARLKGQ